MQYAPTYVAKGKVVEIPADGKGQIYFRSALFKWPPRIRWSYRHTYMHTHTRHRHQKSTWFSRGWLIFQGRSSSSWGGWWASHGWKRRSRMVALHKPHQPEFCSGRFVTSTLGWTMFTEHPHICAQYFLTYWAVNKFTLPETRVLLDRDTEELFPQNPSTPANMIRLRNVEATEIHIKPGRPHKLWQIYLVKKHSCW